MLTDKTPNTILNASFKAVRKDSTLILIGDGDERGLVKHTNSHFRLSKLPIHFVYSKHLDYMRNCGRLICLWNESSVFSKRYNLRGLFCDNIVFDMETAKTLKINTTQDEIFEENAKLSKRLGFMLSKHMPLVAIPNALKSLDDKKSELTKYNYSNIKFRG